jgi:hypothetical protein
MLPLTPFVFYDHKLVVSDQWDLKHLAIPGTENSPELMVWPMEYFQVAGKAIDPLTYGLQAEHEKLWLLAPQFAHNAVLQKEVPTRIYGKALPNSVVRVRFGDFDQELKVGADEDEWEMILPAMKASAEPRLLHVTCLLDGKVAHERKITNVVIGDVWYVAANDLAVEPHEDLPGKGGPAPLDAWQGEHPQLRMMMSLGRFSETLPSRFKLNASGKPSSSHFARWMPGTGLAKELAERIHAKTGEPVGIVILNPRNGRRNTVSIKAWTGYRHLAAITAWKADHNELQPLLDPSPDSVVVNSREYLKRWDRYWQQVAHDPTFETGALVEFPGAGEPQTEATSIHNQSICAFSPGNFKAILCLTSEALLGDTGDTELGRQLVAMANSWKDAFARGKPVIDPHFLCALPTDKAAPGADMTAGVKGKSSLLTFMDQPVVKVERVESKLITTCNQPLLELLDAAVRAVHD